MGHRTAGLIWGCGIIAAVWSYMAGSYSGIALGGVVMMCGGLLWDMDLADPDGSGLDEDAEDDDQHAQTDESETETETEPTPNGGTGEAADYIQEAEPEQ